jgi:putative cardiolipin synthase
MRTLRARQSVVLLLLLGLAGCATLPEKLPRGPAGHALAPQPGGALADLENSLHARLGVDRSAWRLLDSNEDALRWRLALVDSARHSIELQYYFWWEDDTGQLLMKHVVDAADRGVKVRIILDDRTPKVRDWQTAILNAHPRTELRLFNAFRVRSLFGRGIDFLRHMDLMNQRMHNKMLARSAWQRTQDLFFMLFPRNLY